jgi:hypothetical protein
MSAGWVTILKAHDLITSPAYVVIKATNEFKDKTTAINQLWQTDFIKCGARDAELIQRAFSGQMRLLDQRK